MRKTTLLAASLAITFAVGDMCNAQLVQIGPGYVKAPFVRVVRTPQGTYVRAPFTSVGPTAYGPRAYRRGRYVEPYVQPGSTVVTPQVTTGTPVPSQGSSVAPPPPIQQPTQQPTTPEGQRRELAGAARQLQQALSRFPNASGWQQYLRLPEAVFSGLTPGVPTPIDSDVDAEQLGVCLDQYDKIASDPQYRAISEMPTFRQTHDRLANYVDMLKQDDRPVLPPVPTEELPPADPK